MKKKFLFRGLQPAVLMGTASDRYAGWVGQIYTPGRWEEKVTRRSHAVGGATYAEEVLPVESVEEYFRHFPVLELDSTFYRPLLEWDGRPTRTWHLLREYASRLAEGDLLVLKAPQGIFARRVLRAGDFVANEEYLNPGFYVRQFHEPAVKVLGPHLLGVVFEQEYQRKRDRVPPERMAADLDAFFSAIPRDDRHHVELRTESYLAGPVFDVLERHGVGQVLSHWTWLPHLSEQFERSGRRFLNAGRTCLIRLMTPHGVRYEDSYAMAFPFDKLVPGMTSERMVEETAALMQEAVSRGVRACVIVNNRAGGNAPLIADLVARRFRKTGRSA